MISNTPCFQPLTGTNVEKERKRGNSYSISVHCFVLAFGLRALTFPVPGADILWASFGLLDSCLWSMRSFLTLGLTLLANLVPTSHERGSSSQTWLATSSMRGLHELPSYDLICVRLTRALPRKLSLRTSCILVRSSADCACRRTFFFRVELIRVEGLDPIGHLDYRFPNPNNLVPL
ncbi:hypothetical protein J1N35_012413 [Gossypium stocksii]|uniref:Uncharacterized protein n=1 Tax=Gossypium stocksii TaxID=47602 RepID=A0A9D4AE97_9ROSI|nr:hypothetical protein J1N35_012413 [Gossypium stocksii]